MRANIRWQLILWNTLALAGVLFGLGALVYLPLIVSWLAVPLALIVCAGLGSLVAWKALAEFDQSLEEVRRFTADVAHQLRTPLTVLRLQTETALGKQLTPAECRSLLDSILEECNQLTRLTDQLLALARADAGLASVPHRPVDLAELVQDGVATMCPLAEARALALHVRGNGPLRVCGDDCSLRQVLFNLLDNALKYTLAGGTIEVELARPDRHAVLTVRDSGIGIAAEHLPHVFEHFYRVDRARSGDQDGCGLGLSIARGIVRAHGGTIGIRSTVGRGTECTVTLPLLPDP